MSEDDDLDSSFIFSSASKTTEPVVLQFPHSTVIPDPLSSNPETEYQVHLTNGSCEFAFTNVDRNSYALHSKSH
jgi:hypothetical protein